MRNAAKRPRRRTDSANAPGSHPGALGFLQRRHGCRNHPTTRPPSLRGAQHYRVKARGSTPQPPPPHRTAPLPSQDTTRAGTWAISQSVGSFLHRNRRATILSGRRPCRQIGPTPPAASQELIRGSIRVVAVCRGCGLTASVSGNNEKDKHRYHHEGQQEHSDARRH